MLSSLKFAAAAICTAMLATVMVSASPILELEERAPTCKPNFQGKPQTIFQNLIPPKSRTILAWTAGAWTGSPVTLVIQDTDQYPTLRQGEFLVPIGGVGAHSYEFK
jgi:hypothetical protein